MYLTLGLLKKGAGGGGSSGGTYPSIVSNTFNQVLSPPYIATMPATVTGDLLILLASTISNLGEPDATPSGWTQLFSGNFNGFYKWAVGAEPSVTVSVSSAAIILFTVLRIQGADTAQNPQGARVTINNTTVPDPPALDPSWATANNLFIAVALADEPTTIVSYPANYTLHQQANSVGSGATFVAARQLASSASENPGAFTLSALADYRSGVATIAVKGAP